MVVWYFKTSLVLCPVVLVQYSIGRFVSGRQMVQYSNDGLKTGQKKACLWSNVTLLFDNQTPILSGIQMNPVYYNTSTNL